MATKIGFRRFVLSIQYHGGSFLGFPYLGEKNENCVLPDGTDLRGYVSVEGRLRSVFDNMFGEHLYGNIQVSSRTDRGVHALMNTMHFDVSGELAITQSDSVAQAINFHLAKTDSIVQNDQSRRIKNDSQMLQGSYYCRSSLVHDLRVLRALPAPPNMPNPQGFVYNQPDKIDWNARYSATERTYVYRVLHNRNNPEDAMPFEWDRAWCIYDQRPMNTPLMQAVGDILTGTHDFSSFRAARCQRSSPIVSIDEIVVSSKPYSLFGILESASVSIITIKIRANSFLYHQVRYMVGCMVAVGRGKMTVAQVQDLLLSKSRVGFPGRAPAHGLYLTHVRHQDIEF